MDFVKIQRATMGKNAADIIILCMLAASFSILFVVNKTASNAEFVNRAEPKYHWIVQGLLNVVGYSTIVIPGYLVYKYVKKINYLDKGGTTCLGTIIRSCFSEDELIDHNSLTQLGAGSQNRTTCEEITLLLYYFTGLLVAFLIWGVLQEKIITQKYVNQAGEEGYFKDSQFLVFVNRVLAFVMSGTYIYCSRQPRHRCPMYKYIYCSISNILSSWCQYEALKYLSFPHQVIGKAAKIIPVMVMGKIVSRTKYETYEYVTAFVLSIGMLFFMWDTGNDKATSTVTTFSGVFLLCSYIVFDSFTSNWQGALFKQYHMSPVQMMCVVNLFSCAFTSISLIQQGGFATSIRFMLQFPAFVFDCLLISVCSAGGQLFIYSTLATFGPLVFAIITTIRQGFSILLSCIIYHHEVHALGVLGVSLVFASIFLRIYCSHRIKVLRNKAKMRLNQQIDS